MLALWLTGVVLILFCVCVWLSEILLNAFFSLNE